MFDGKKGLIAIDQPFSPFPLEEEMLTRGTTPPTSRTHNLVENAGLGVLGPGMW